MRSESRQVAWVAHAQAGSEAITRFLAADRSVQSYRFIFASSSGVAPGRSINRTFSATASVCSPFGDRKVWVLDRETVEEMTRTSSSSFYIDYSISLDTQAMSYLRSVVDPKRSRKVPDDAVEMFDFISRDDVYVDPIPYVNENFLDIDQPKKADHLFENFKVYEVLRTLDLKRYRERREICSTLSDDELNRKAQQSVSKMFTDAEDKPMTTGLRLRHTFMYLLLLEMTRLHFNNGSPAKKLCAFLEFSHVHMATMSLRGAVLARALFERRAPTFFKDVQRNKPNLLKALRNMAWDVLHVQNLEEALTFRMNERARYFFPALLSFDRGLIEMMNLCPLRTIAFKEQSYAPMPFYDVDWHQLFLAGKDSYKTLGERYWNEQEVQSRDRRRNLAMDNFGNLVMERERALEFVA